MPTHFLTLPDGRIAFDDQGHGPLIPCVPGGGDLRSQYRFLTPQLVAAGYRVVTMDLRGQGESSVTWPEYTDCRAGFRYVGADQPPGGWTSLHHWDLESNGRGAAGSDRSAFQSPRPDTHRGHGRRSPYPLCLHR